MSDDASSPPEVRKPPRAPTYMGRAGRRLWRSLHEDGWRFRPDELVVLEHACRTADDAERIRQALADAALTVAGSRGQTVAHPLLGELRDARTLLLRLLGSLGLEEAEAEADGSGSSWDGLSAQQRARRAARHRWGARYGSA